MKSRLYLLLLFFLSLPFVAAAQGVGVGTTTPAASAALDVTSTSKGLLLPRMTSAQRVAIPNPVTGLFVFQTNGTPGLYYYIGTTWVNLGTGTIPDAGGNAGTNPGLLVSTLAGNGTAGFANGAGTAAQFNSPYGVAVDGSGNVYVADYVNHRIRKIMVAMGVVSTLAGSGTAGNADGAGTADGAGAAAQFNYPSGLVVDGSVTVYVAD